MMREGSERVWELMLKGGGGDGCRGEVSAPLAPPTVRRRAKPRKLYRVASGDGAEMYGIESSDSLMALLAA